MILVRRKKEEGGWRVSMEFVECTVIGVLRDAIP
jgi:hypothetical protein